MCSALYELSFHLGNKGLKYKQIAGKTVSSLSSVKYRATVGDIGNFLLMHSVGSKPSNFEVNVPLIYADYYFLKANLLKLRIEEYYQSVIKWKRYRKKNDFFIYLVLGIAE
jgi:unsaturated chondroitin disaccharide hydrolase